MGIIHNIKVVALTICLVFSISDGFAQSNSNRISLGVGALYERGFDATISVEHETKNRRTRQTLWSRPCRC